MAFSRARQGQAEGLPPLLSPYLLPLSLCAVFDLALLSTVSSLALHRIAPDHPSAPTTAPQPFASFFFSHPSAFYHRLLWSPHYLRSAPCDLGSARPKLRNSSRDPESPLPADHNQPRFLPLDMLKTVLRRSSAAARLSRPRSLSTTARAPVRPALLVAFAAAGLAIPIVSHPMLQKTSRSGLTFRWCSSGARVRSRSTRPSITP